MKGSPECPLVSIVIPAYNAGDFLREAIDSVLNQTYPDIELIVLDDGSTDQTRDVLSSYPKGSFFWESHPNMGQAATLNKGWAMAKGEVLGYLSADDALLPDAVAESVQMLLDHPEIVFTYPDYLLFDSSGRDIRKVAAPEYSYRDMLVRMVVAPGPGALFRRSAYEKAGGWDSRLHQMPDFDFWLRLGLVGNGKRIPKVLAKFRVHEGSQSYAASSIEKSEECVRLIRNFFERDDLPEDLRKYEQESLAYAHMISMRLHFRSGRVVEAWSHVKAALECSPKAFFSLWGFKLFLNALRFRLRRYLRSISLGFIS
ncbi:MAG: glycosyltransferase [Gammaproteobacteria bacterium]|nr:MAG: glycosyltransferase [Gammaproteobacteria bacterium]